MGLSPSFLVMVMKDIIVYAGERAFLCACSVRTNPPRLTAGDGALTQSTRTVSIRHVGEVWQAARVKSKMLMRRF